MKRLLPLLLAPSLLFGEAGVLIPSNLQQPDPAVLSLAEMNIRIHIDNHHARVETRQIFASHRGAVLEGNYTFALPGRALISDFAIWDGVTRIPGVILERKQAAEIYNMAKMQAIDPGLLQMGERDADQVNRSAVFSAHIVPIPPFGTKRVELEYQERLQTENLQTLFAVPLRPDAYRAQSVGHLTISLELTSPHPMKDFEIVGKAYPLTIKEKTANRVTAEFDGRNVSLSEDLAIKYTIDPAKRDTLEVITYKDGPSEPGFFEASAVIGPSAAAKEGPKRTVIALFDASLSMQWEKLERSFLALDKLLRSLRPQDSFNLLLFNSEVSRFSPTNLPANPEAVDKALAFVRASRLRGGTNLQAALQDALSASAGAQGGESYIVLLSDGDATRGASIQNVKIADWYSGRLKQLKNGPRTYIFAVGDDANMPLLKMLTRNNGVLEWVRSTEPADFKLDAFLAKIGRRPVESLNLTADPASNFSMVYPLEASVFPGSIASWVGQYKNPLPQARFSVLQMRTTVPLPAQSVIHPQLPRTWAKARVDALLEKIEREGEDRATIDEIIRLSRKYKFVTPYTSFLAAPRALLRPRLIRPGDPVLRVRTDESITSVVAMFPFGLVKKLRYLKEEDTWQTRFLAPSDMPDGMHSVRLMLRDKDGRVFRESKTFVIASKPPSVKIRLEKTQFHRGETVHVKASASESSRTVVARMYGVSPVNLRWNTAAGANAADLIIPAYLPAGRYPLTVSAEDFAHNIGTQEVMIEILP
ncbi:MAG: VIT and VWA domain-containing protein [Bryobacteraceae bacterium]